MYEGKIHVHANPVGSKLIQQTLIHYSNSTNLTDIHTGELKSNGKDLYL